MLDGAAMSMSDPTYVDDATKPLSPKMWNRIQLQVEIQLK